MDRLVNAPPGGEQNPALITNAQSAAHPSASARSGHAAHNRSVAPRNQSTWTSALAVLGTIAGVCWLVYGGAIHAPFVFDDRSCVNENLSIVKLWPLLGDGESNGPLTPPRDNVTSGRPLVNLTFAINYYFGQTNPTGYHVFNFAIHVLNAWLLWMIVRGTLRLPYFHGRLDSVASPLALATSLVWGLHPLQTEAVEYVSQRTESMMALFYLATVAASLHYWSARTSPARTGWLAAATIACACGMACKEVMVTVPVIVLLFERTFIARSFRGAMQESWPLYLGLSLGWLVLLALNFGAPRSGSAGFGVGIAATSWWLTQSKVLLIYLKLAGWPWPLSIHYDMPYHHSLATAWPYAAPVALLILGTVVLVWRKTAVGFCVACLLIILSPTLVVPIALEIAAERRMYLPMAALVPLVIVSGYWFLDCLQRRSVSKVNRAPGNQEKAQWSPLKITVTAASILAAIFGLVSNVRLSAYRDLLSIWQDAAIHQPDNVLVLTCLGAQLTGAGRYDEATQALRRALTLRPDTKQLGVHKQLGAALVAAGRQQEAIEPLQEALRLDPDAPGVERVLGIALFNSGYATDAIEHLQRAVVAAPNDVGARESLGVVLLVNNRPQDAIPVFLHALQINPRSIQAECNLAIAYAKVDRAREAADAAEKAIQMARQAGTPHAAASAEAWLQTYRQEHSAR